MHGMLPEKSMLGTNTKPVPWPEAYHEHRFPNIPSKMPTDAPHIPSSTHAFEPLHAQLNSSGSLVREAKPAAGGASLGWRVWRAHVSWQKDDATRLCAGEEHGCADPLW